MDAQRGRRGQLIGIFSNGGLCADSHQIQLPNRGQ